MRYPARLPTALPTPAFSAAQARAAGVSEGRLRGSDLRSPFRGIRVVGEPGRDAFVQRCTEYAPRLKPWQFFSHETALALLGVPLPRLPYAPRIHVSAHRPAREPRISGIVGHRLQTRVPALVESPHGFLVEDPVRAWRQTGTLWQLDDLIAAADHLISPRSGLATREQLSSEIVGLGDVRRQLLGEALDQARIGSESPEETALRLLLIRNALPEPQLNWVLHDERGQPVVRLDLAYPKHRVAAEYDGRVHAEDIAQFERDADRWDAIRAMGWRHVRILRHHTKGSGSQAVEKVRSALHAAGWVPPAAL